MAHAYSEGAAIGTAGRVARSSITHGSGSKVVYSRAIRIGDIDMLIATEQAGALAQVMNGTNREAVGLASGCSIHTASVCLGHTALGDQRGVTQAILGASVPDVTIAAPVHCGITLAGRSASIERIGDERSRSGAGGRADSVVDVFILAAQPEVFPRPGCARTPYFFGSETDALLQVVGVITGVTAEDVKTHAHEIGMVRGRGLTIELAVSTARIAIAAKATGQEAGSNSAGIQGIEA